MWIKICGAVDRESVRCCLDAGVDALGINLVPTSRRYVPLDVAKDLCDYAREAIELVLVVADLPESRLREIATYLNPTHIQLHGREPHEQVGMGRYKAIAVEDAEDVRVAEAWPGDLLLVDAKGEGGTYGGAGHSFDWNLVRGLCARRRVIVAGGLRPDNVADAIQLLAPFGVDAASGVEPPGRPGKKDPSLVQAFVANARMAAGS